MERPSRGHVSKGTRQTVAVARADLALHLRIHLDSHHIRIAGEVLTRGYGAGRHQRHEELAVVREDWDARAVRPGTNAGSMNNTRGSPAWNVGLVVTSIAMTSTRPSGGRAPFSRLV